MIKKCLYFPENVFLSFFKNSYHGNIILYYVCKYLNNSLTYLFRLAYLHYRLWFNFIIRKCKKKKKIGIKKKKRRNYYYYHN